MTSGGPGTRRGPQLVVTAPGGSRLRRGFDGPEDLRRLIETLAEIIPAEPGYEWRVDPRPRLGR